MRLSTLLRILLLCTPLAPGALGLAHADEQERDYTGLALCWYFGGASGKALDADLSIGRLRMSVDLEQRSSVIHLPLLQVPLISQGGAMLAPIQALAETLGLLRLGRPPAPAAAAPDCRDAYCAALAASLPDLSAR